MLSLLTCQMFSWLLNFSYAAPIRFSISPRTASNCCRETSPLRAPSPALSRRASATSSRSDLVSRNISICFRSDCQEEKRRNVTCLNEKKSCYSVTNSKSIWRCYAILWTDNIGNIKKILQDRKLKHSECSSTLFVSSLYRQYPIEGLKSEHSTQQPLK